MQSIKSYILLFSIIISVVISLAGCSTISVTQDYDPGYDFSKLKTFEFLPIPEDAGIDQLNAKRLGEAIKTNLIAKGYTLSEEADFGIALHFGQQTKTDVQSYNYHYGGWWGSEEGVQVTQYDEGTLVIDFIDMAKNELVWRGTGSGVISQSPSIEERTENINKAVAQILAQFPPTNNL